MYLKPCSVCGFSVSPGEGTVEKVDSVWVVTHDDPCPRNPASRSRAQDAAVAASRVLENENSDIYELENAVASLSRLMRTGWVLPEICTNKILSCRACERLDRLDVEELIAVYLHQEPTQRSV